MSYTKGQWRVYRNKVGVGVGTQFADVAKCSGLCSERPDEEVYANACLMAAAPDLLEALPDLTAVISWLKAGCSPAAAAEELERYATKIKYARERAKGL